MSVSTPDTKMAVETVAAFNAVIEPLVEHVVAHPSPIELGAARWIKFLQRLVPMSFGTCHYFGQTCIVVDPQIKIGICN